MGFNKTTRALNSVKQLKPIVSKDFILPNNSGDHQKSIKRNTPTGNKDLVNKKYVDDAINAISTPTLQTVTDAGNTTSNSIELPSINDTNSLASIDVDSRLLSDISAATVYNWGENQMATELNMDSNKVISLGTPTADADAVTKKYVDDANALLVPYTGATGNIDLGSHNLTTTGTLQAEHLYSTDDLVVDDTASIDTTIISAGRVLDSGLALTVKATSVTVDLGTGLISFWKLDDNAANTTVTDTKGVDNGVLNGGDNTEDKHITAGVPSGLSAAFDFNGTDDRVQSLSDFDISGGGSVSVWFNVIDASPSTTDLVLVSRSAGSNRWSIGVNTNGYIGTNVWDGSYTGKAATATTGWHHVLFVFDGSSTVTSYLDGVEMTVTGQIITISSSSQGMAFGGRNNGSANWFNGDISNVRIYSTQLTEAHAVALYNSGNGTESITTTGTVATVTTDDNNLTVGGDLAVTGDSTFTGDIAINADITTDGTATATLGGTLSFTGATIITDGTLEAVILTDGTGIMTGGALTVISSIGTSGDSDLITLSSNKVLVTIGNGTITLGDETNSRAFYIDNTTSNKTAEFNSAQYNIKIGDETNSYAIDSTGGDVRITGGGLVISNMKSGATQGAAGAAANELWKTASHATLPDNVVMIGV